MAKSLRNAGLAVKTIQQFVALSQEKPTEEIRKKQKALFAEQLDLIDQKMKDLQKTREVLQGKLDSFDQHLSRVGFNDEEQNHIFWKSE
ncbi:MAG: MerR family DNA-binding protein [Streptococcaceae bacterium]|nr:MerR family DNA-binding protein [Streptococcaceae bacterium]